MINLKDKLKELTGRKLSEKEMKIAKKAITSERPIHFENRISRHYNTLDIHQDGKRPQILIEDISNLRFYNEEGLLVAKARRHPIGGIEAGSHIIYQPAGSFFGKKNDRYQDYSLEENDLGIWFLKETSPEREGRFRPLERTNFLLSKSSKPATEVRAENDFYSLFL